MEQHCRHPPKCKRVPSNLGYWDSATRRWRNATVVASCWKWKEEMVNGTYHQPQMTSLLSLPRGGPIGKMVNKSVVTWGTYTFIAELNVWGRCKQLFCLFLWSSPVFFELTWCQRIASTSPRNYKYWSRWRLGVKWRVWNILQKLVVLAYVIKVLIDRFVLHLNLVELLMSRWTAFWTFRKTHIFCHFQIFRCDNTDSNEWRVNSS